LRAKSEGTKYKLLTMPRKKAMFALIFQQDWVATYALQVSTRDPVSIDVSSVVCLLCSSVGGHNSSDTHSYKQERMSNDECETAPWHTDTFVSHQEAYE
jgi:hypothetical protein